MKRQLQPQLVGDEELQDLTIIEHFVVKVLKTGSYWLETVYNLHIDLCLRWGRALESGGTDINCPHIKVN